MKTEMTLIADNFQMIHNIITRGLQVSIDNLDAVIKGKTQLHEKPQGLYNYILSLAVILHSHHNTEDELVFPYFKKILPNAPYARLNADHLVVSGLLGELHAALKKCEKDEQTDSELGKMLLALIQINEMWHPHIQVETEEFLGKADALIAPEEQMRLIALFSEHGQKLSQPPFLVIPFLIFNLPADEREKFTRGIPAEVTGHLVPVVWKDQWESMKPYLLM